MESKMNKILIELTNNGYIVQEYTQDPVSVDKWVFQGEMELSDWINENFNPHAPTPLSLEGDKADAI